MDHLRYYIGLLAKHLDVQIALLVAPEPDERERLGQLLRQGLKRIRRPSAPAPEGPPGPA